MMIKLQFACATTFVAAFTTAALAHDGRRFEVKVVNDQLVAQGYNSAGEDDGGGVRRPYYNALHDHWENLPTVEAATATLPGYDLFEPGPLVGHDLVLTLTGARKWVAPPPMPAPGTLPTLEPLTDAEKIFVTLGDNTGGTTIDTASGGSLTLADAISTDGADDLDLGYDIALKPSNVIYVLELTLSTNAPGIAPSDTIYTLLSPDGADPTQRLHHASLFLESHLGTPIPEPSAFMITAIGGAMLLRRGTRALK